MNTTSRVLSEVLAQAERRRDGVLPWHGIDGIEEAFADAGSLLQALQMRWFTTVTARLDDALEIGSADPEEQVRSVYRDVADSRPGLREVLDVHADHPALAHGLRRERLALAAAGGRAPAGAREAAVAAYGAALVDDRGRRPGRSGRRPGRLCSGLFPVRAA